MWENHVGDVLNVRKICKRCAKYKKIYGRIMLKVTRFVTDVLNQKKIFKGFTACGKIIWDVLN